MRKTIFFVFICVLNPKSPTGRQKNFTLLLLLQKVTECWVAMV